MIDTALNDKRKPSTIPNTQFESIKTVWEVIEKIIDISPIPPGLF